MLKTLMLSLIFFAPLAAQEVLPKIVIETLEAPVAEVQEQYNLKDKITNMLFSLGFIIVAAVAVTIVLKKINRKRLESVNSNSSIKVLERRTLAAKTNLYVIEVHNKTLLIGESADGLVALSELSPGPEDKPTSQEPLSFTQVLKKKML